jgi:hypothetical protein
MTAEAVPVTEAVPEGNAGTAEVEGCVETIYYCL